MKIYCPTCGSATEYSLSKPKFCASCGESFTSLGKATAKKVFNTTPVQKNTETRVAQIEEEEEHFEMPNISRLHVDISSSKGYNVTSFQDLAKSNIDGFEDGYRRETDTSYSKESLAEDFLRDAGSSPRANEQTEET